jgi:hypothetical protein
MIVFVESIVGDILASKALAVVPDTDEARDFVGRLLNNTYLITDEVGVMASVLAANETVAPQLLGTPPRLRVRYFHTVAELEGDVEVPPPSLHPTVPPSLHASTPPPHHPATPPPRLSTPRPLALHGTISLPTRICISTSHDSHHPSSHHHSSQGFNDVWAALVFTAFAPKINVTLRFTHTAIPSTESTLDRFTLGLSQSFVQFYSSGFLSMQRCVHPPALAPPHPLLTRLSPRPTPQRRRRSRLPRFPRRG